MTTSNALRTISTRYGHLSRGRSWGKWYAGKTQPVGDWEWVEHDGGTLYIPDGPGLLVYGSTDGFSRKERKHETFEEAAA